MARPKLNLTDEERRERVNKQKYEFLKKYLQTEEGKEYRKKMVKNRQNKYKELKETVSKLQEQIEILNKALPEPPKLGEENNNFQLKV